MKTITTPTPARQSSCPNLQHVAIHERDIDIFTHDNRSMDIIDFLPPITYIAWNKDERRYVTRQITDSKYQTLADDLDNRPLFDYGECWSAAANHAMNMTALDRMIFEDGHNGSGNVQRPGMNVPQIPKLQRIEYIAKQCECTLDQTEDLIDFWHIIDPEYKIWQSFIDWTVSGGIDKALAYFESLAGALVGDDIDINEKPMGNDDIWMDVEAGEFEQDDQLILLENDGEFNFQINSLEDLDEYWTQIMVCPESTKEKHLPHEVEAIFDRYGYYSENGIFILDKGFSTPDLFRYAQINQNDPEHLPAIVNGKRTYQTVRERLPIEYLAIYDSIETANLETINKLRREAHTNKDSNAWDYLMRTCFWSASLNRKNSLELIKRTYIKKLLDSISAVEQRTLTMMRNTKSVKQAKYYWYLLYQALEGKGNMGRTNFVQYVLKPELHKRHAVLKDRPESTPINESVPAYTDEDLAYMESCNDVIVDDYSDERVASIMHNEL